MTLEALQRAFCAYLVDPDQARETLFAPAVSALARRGLPVYHHAFRATLVECLRDTFEKTHAWLGDAQFDLAARTHVAAHPSASWTLAGYGGDFEQTLAVLYPDDPEVAELAWLDRALRTAFDGPDGACLDPVTLDGTDWDTAGFHLVPTLVFRRIVSNAPAIWSALAAEMPPPEPALLETRAVLSVWRHDLMPRFCTITDAEQRALELASVGEPFAGICAAVFPDAEVAAAVGAMLGRWIGDGIVTRIVSSAGSE